jgi:serine/threonine protein kinase
MVDHLDNSVAVADKEPKGLATVGSWLFLPPEQIIHLLKMLKQDYKTYVEEGRPVEGIRTIKFKRTQMDDIWALGVIFYQFLAGGKYPFGEPRNLADMVNSILLTKFDFRPIDSRLRDLVSSMLEKDPQKRFQRLLQGCPENIQSRRVLAEAILYKLEQVVSEHASE